MTKSTVRGAFTAELLALAKKDRSLYALATDSRGSVTLTAFADELPSQFVECGIAEQDAVGIAAGLANAGLRPFVCGPACFYSMRSAEQVKADVSYSHMNVKIIGVSGGVSYGALGSTHHSTQDIALMRALPGMEVYLPSDAVQMRALTRYLAKDLGKYNIRVNCVAPAAVYTNIYVSSGDYTREAYDRWSVEKAPRYPLGRIGYPKEDLAPTIEFLLSDKCTWTTGGRYAVDSGMGI